MLTKLEYIWLDGTEPTTQLRSKTKVVEDFKQNIQDWPVWGFDCSSTNQAEGANSDCVLKPVRVYVNPLELNSHLVLCEVWNVDDTPHESNTRRLLEETITDGIDEWVGFEQEYTLFKGGKPYGWPSVGQPPPQGDYYCGRNIGEKVSREHMNACIEAGISICGTNAEVMLGQWEYQIGAGGSIHMSDDLWVARWLLERICESYNLTASLHPKPIAGDWNGAGCHTNFSTKEMREDGGYENFIYPVMEKLEKKHQQHIDAYGVDNDQRLTGLHETCDINTFRWGVSDRGASIRIPWQVAKENKGYLEDRRPSSNMDPYKVTSLIMKNLN